MKKEIVSVEWLKNNLTKDNIILLDASPESTAGGKVSSFSGLHIPGSRIFDIKAHFTNTASKFPNTVPSAAQFEQACQALGINADSEIVVYDNFGIYTSPRVWWLFKVMGHENVRVLDGGLPEWINQGHETTQKPDLKQAYQPGNFKSQFHEKYLIRYEDVLENIEANKFLVVDARPEGRFAGTAPEPRKHLKSGNIPNSVNIPYKTLLENGKFKTEQEIREIFSEKIDKPTELVFSCGSGMTACILILASTMAFQKSKYLYDGSWTEYAELQNLTKQ